MSLITHLYDWRADWMLDSRFLGLTMWPNVRTPLGDQIG